MSDDEGLQIRALIRSPVRARSFLPFWTTSLACSRCDGNLVASGEAWVHDDDGTPAGGACARLARPPPPR